MDKNAIKNDVEIIRSLMHPWTIIGVTAWAFLFTLLFFSPRFGLGLVWKEKIRDYDKASSSLGVLVFGMTVAFFLISAILDPSLAADEGTRWWHGIAFGFIIGAVISFVAIIVNAVHRWLYDKFISQSDPESWGLTWLRCFYNVILTTVAGMILTVFR